MHEPEFRNSESCINCKNPMWLRHPVAKILPENLCIYLVHRLQTHNVAMAADIAIGQNKSVLTSRTNTCSTQQTWSGFSPTTVPDNNRQSGLSPTTVPKISDYIQWHWMCKDRWILVKKCIFINLSVITFSFSHILMYDRSEAVMQ